MSRSSTLLPHPERHPRHVRLPALWLIPIVFGLLCIHAALGLWAASTKSLTFDEPIHLTAGMSYWTYDDYRLQPENGVLPQRLESLPARLIAPRTFPGPDARGWDTANVFLIGRQWLRTLGPRMQEIIMSARCANMLLSLALGLTVFLWSRRLFGDLGGIVSLSLYAFCPTMLAHGPMISSDMASALFFTLSCAAIWALFHRVSPARILVLGLAAGGMAVSKFSAPLLVAMAAILLIVRWFGGPAKLPVAWWNTVSVKIKPGSAKIPLVLFPSLVASGGVGLLIVWGFLGFRFSQTAHSLPMIQARLVAWEELSAGHDFATRVVLFARSIHLLPDAYLYGQLFVLNGAKARNCFWDGEFSIYGWPMFFPYAFAVKTPLTTLCVLLFSAVAWGRYCLIRGKGRKRDPSLIWFYRFAPLLTLICVYAAAAISSHLNIGHRHILPIYPALYILGGAASWWMSRVTRWQSIVVGGLVLLLAIETLWIWPNYLSYFNQAVGGSRNGYKHLIDSSLDWGQDLPTLRTWLDEQGIDPSDKSIPDTAPLLKPSVPVYLSYFGSVDPAMYGLHLRYLRSYFDFYKPQGLPQPLVGGVYCVSATMLQNINSQFPGRWNGEYELAYRQLAHIVAEFVNAPPGSPERQRLVETRGAAYWSEAFSRFDDIRFGRLTAYLRHREPDHLINSSILIYRLTDQQVQEALEGPPVELEDSDGVR